MIGPAGDDLGSCLGQPSESVATTLPVGLELVVSEMLCVCFLAFRGGWNQAFESLKSNSLYFVPEAEFLLGRILVCTRQHQPIV